MNSNMSIVSGKIFEAAYRKKNYCIIDDPAISDGYCAIFFSSAGIYYPNTEEALRKNILVEDRYEWWNAKIPFVSRYIFVRDIAKAFYMWGINKDNPDIEHVISMLKEMTNGYKVITIGSSAGGYMAVLAGCVLENCEYVLDFSGFYNLFVLNDEQWPLVSQYKHCDKYRKWFELNQLITKKKCNIYMFYTSLLAEDKLQTEFASNSVKIFQIKSEKHGIPFCKNNLYRLIRLNNEEIERLYQLFQGKSLISETAFSIALNNGNISGICRLLEGKLQDKLKANL